MGDRCSLVVCGAPLGARAHDIAAELVGAGWTVQVLATPAAGRWVDVTSCASVTGRPVVGLSDARAERHPDVVVAAPVTFNTVGKLAHGIADTPAHSFMAEVLGERSPVFAVPTLNATLSANPAWEPNWQALTAAGVQWVSVHDGSLGPPRSVVSGSSDQLVAAFDPRWVTAHLLTLV